MRRGAFLLLVFLLLIVPNSFGEGDVDDDVLYSSKIKTHLTLTTTYNIFKTSSKYKVEYVTVKLSYLPLTSYRQSVISHITSPKAEEAADFMIFSWDNPTPGEKTFRSEYVVETLADYYPINEKVAFPLEFLPREVVKYTKPTDLIDINSDIKSVANELAQSKDDLYEVVYEAARWVNENIEYDLSTVTASASLSSTWVMKNKKGVCDELTNLFISLLRSLGIPAKFVSGISYTNSPSFTTRWGPHGWAEVYFPGHGWVPFDPTYDQAGYVDAGHIKLKESVDSDKSSIEYEWLSYGANIVGDIPTNDVAILSKGPITKSPASISINSLKDRVGFGSYNAIKTVIKNNVDEYRVIQLTLIGTSDVTIENPSRPVLLKPKEQKEMYWKVVFPSILSDPRGTYTFPFVVYDNFNNSYQTSVEVSKKNTKLDEAYVNGFLETNTAGDNVLEANIVCEHKQSIKQGETLTINCVLEEETNRVIKVCYKEVCEDWVGQQGGVIFEEAFEESGSYSLIITAELEDKKKAYYGTVFVADKPLLLVEFDDYKKSINYSESEKISFTLSQESLSSPEDLKLYLTYNHRTSKMEIRGFETAQLFQFVVKGSELGFGENKILVRAEYLGIDGEIYSQEFEETISMNTSVWWQKTLSKLNTFLNIIENKLLILFTNLY